MGNEGNETGNGKQGLMHHRHACVMHLANYQATEAELLMGSGRFIASKSIDLTLPEVGKRLFPGAKIIISTGSRV